VKLTTGRSPRPLSTSGLPPLAETERVILANQHRMSLQRMGVQKRRDGKIVTVTVNKTLSVSNKKLWENQRWVDTTSLTQHN